MGFGFSKILIFLRCFKLSDDLKTFLIVNVDVVIHFQEFKLPRTYFNELAEIMVGSWDIFGGKVLHPIGMRVLIRSRKKLSKFALN